MVRPNKLADKVSRKSKQIPQSPPIRPIATQEQLVALHHHTVDLVEGIKRYEEMASVFQHAATVPGAMALQRLGIPVLAVEQVLSEIGFDGERMGGPIGTFINEGNAFEILLLLQSTMSAARLSRHAETLEQRHEVTQCWGKIANGGWGIVPNEPLPQLHELIPPLELVVRRLRELVQPSPPTNQTAPTSQLIIYSLGNCIYRVENSRPYELNPDEDAILQAFMRRPAMGEKNLKRETNNADARSVLLRLRDKYDKVFAAAIDRPPGKSAGGYCAIVLSVKQS